MKDKYAKPKKVVFEASRISETTDPETGEIVELRRETKAVTRQATAGTLTFTKMFFTDLFKIYGLSKGAMMVFIEMGGMIDDDNNQIILTPVERKQIGDRTNLKKQAVYNATRELVSAGLIQRVVNNVYMIDPNIFAVGTDPRVLGNRKEYESLKKINMRVEYSKEGRKIEVSVEKAD